MELTDNGDEYQETQHQCSQNDRGIRENQPLRGRVPRLVHVFLHYALRDVSSIQAGLSSMSVDHHLFDERGMVETADTNVPFRERRRQERILIR